MTMTTYERFMSTAAGREAIARAAQRMSEHAIRFALELFGDVELTKCRDSRCGFWDSMPWPWTYLVRKQGHPVGLSRYALTEDHADDTLEEILECVMWWAQCAESRSAPKPEPQRPSGDELRKARDARRKRADHAKNPRRRNPWTPEKKLAAARKRVATTERIVAELKAKVEAANPFSLEGIGLQKALRRREQSLAMAHSSVARLARMVTEAA
jgi:hypothetical protein